MIASTASHRENVIERLRSRPALAEAYIQASVEAGDQAALQVALRTVAEARSRNQTAAAARVK